MKKRITSQLYLFLIPLIVLALLWLFFPRPEKQFYPSEPNKEELTIITDELEGGNSTGELLVKKDSIVFQSEIGDKLQFPFAAFGISNADNSEIDLSPFNEIHFFINATKSGRIPVNLIIEDYVLKSGKKINLILISHIKYLEGKRNYMIPLENFEVPSWWFLINHVDENEVSLTDLSGITSLNIHTDQLLSPGVEDVITLYGIKFKNNPNTLLWNISAVVLLVDLLCFVVFLFRMKYRVELVPVPYVSQQVENLAESEIEKIQHFISHNYHLKVTTQLVQQETGISKSRIPTLLKQEMDTTLKKLLTTIRLNEARRLLKESDLPVNEIADQVGFGHVSHFNRVFKEVEGKTPNEFRSTAA